MLSFKEISLSDRQWADKLFKMGNNNSEEFNFSFCYIWKEVFSYKAARMNDYIIIGSFKKWHPPAYLFPAGSGDIAPVLEELKKTAEAVGDKLVFYCVLEPHKKLLETMYPGQFVFMELTDYYDYVYDAQSLITLSGKKLHGKRNHINRFKGYYSDWRYEPITPELLPQVMEMNEKWHKENEIYRDKTFDDELKSVDNAIHDFFALGMDGGLIRAGGKVVAFSMGERLNFDTYLVHIEKALTEVPGAYAIINQQFAQHNCGDFLYINREDDSGNEGLRKAKRSYRPVFMVEKYAAKLANKVSL